MTVCRHCQKEIVERDGRWYHRHDGCAPCEDKRNTPPTWAEPKRTAQETFVIDGRWTIRAEKRNELLLLKVSCADGESFCTESVQAHMQPQTISLMIGAFKTGADDCALPDVVHTCGEHPAS